MDPKVLTPPSVVMAGTVARVVERDGMAVSEVWEPGTGWVPGGNVASVDWAPPASRELLDSLGVPS